MTDFGDHESGVVKYKLRANRASKQHLKTKETDSCSILAMVWWRIKLALTNYQLTAEALL